MQKIMIFHFLQKHFNIRKKDYTLYFKQHKQVRKNLMNNLWQLNWHVDFAR